MEDYDAELTMYKPHPYFEGVLQGYVHHDSKGRFSDGEFIRTSTVVSIKDGIAQTINTRYKLGEKA